MAYKSNNPKFIGKCSEFAFQYYASMLNIAVAFARMGMLDCYTEYKGNTQRVQIKTAGWREKSNVYYANTKYSVYKPRSLNGKNFIEYKKYSPEFVDCISLICLPDDRLPNAVIYNIPIDIAKDYASISVAPHKSIDEMPKKQAYWEQFRDDWGLLKGKVV